MPISEKRSTFEQKQKEKQTEGLVYNRHQNPSVDDWNYSGKPTQEKNEFNKNIKSLTLVVDMDESLINTLKEYETLDELTINTRRNNPDEIQSILKSLKNIKNVATLNISNTKWLQYIDHLSVDELNITQPSLDADDIQILSQFLCSNQSCTFSSLTDGLMLNTMKFLGDNSEPVRLLLLKHSAQFRVPFGDINYSDEFGNTFNGVDLTLNGQISTELKQLLGRITELNSLELNGSFLEDFLPNLKAIQHIFIKKDSKWLRLLTRPFNLNFLSIKCDLAPKDILDLISLIERRIIPFTEDDIVSSPPKLVLSKATKIRFSKIKAERDSEKTQTEIEKLDNAVHTGDLFQTQETTTGVSFRQISKSNSSHILRNELTGNFSSLQKQKHSDPHKTKKKLLDVDISKKSNEDRYFEVTKSVSEILKASLDSEEKSNKARSESESDSASDAYNITGEPDPMRFYDPRDAIKHIPKKDEKSITHETQRLEHYSQLGRVTLVKNPLLNRNKRKALKAG